MPLKIPIRVNLKPDSVLESLIDNQAHPAPPITIDKINYQPLQKMNSALKDSASYILKKYAKPLIAAAVIVILFSIAFKNGGLLITYIIIVAIAISIRKDSNKNKAWEEFGAANGWSFGSESWEELIPPSLQFGHSQLPGLVLKTNLRPVPLELFSYRCTTGDGKYSVDHYFTVAKVDLPQSQPHIMLLSKASHTDARAAIPNHQTLRLEGDFNDHFKLLVQDGQEVDVLKILTPDVMQTLVNYNNNEDIEINGQSLYFICAKDKRDYKNMPALIESAAALSDRIVQNISLAAGPQTMPDIIAPPPAQPIIA